MEASTICREAESTSTRESAETTTGSTSIAWGWCTAFKTFFTILIKYSSLVFVA
jgi:hypothetical protein